jgi:hypothetical protein
MTTGNYAPINDLWMTSSSSFQAPADLTAAGEVAGMMYAPEATPCGGAEGMYALQEYGLGLDMPTGDVLTMGEEPVSALLDGNNF